MCPELVTQNALNILGKKKVSFTQREPSSHKHLFLRILYLCKSLQWSMTGYCDTDCPLLSLQLIACLYEYLFLVWLPSLKLCSVE